MSANTFSLFCNSIVSFFIILFIGCKERQRNIPKNTPANQKEIQIEINKNIETIGIILNLSDLGDYILGKYHGNDYSLVKLYRKEFDEFKSHPAVLKVNELGKLDLLQFGYYYYGLSFTELPEFKLLYPRFDEFYSSDELTKEQIEKELQEFDKLVKDFYLDAQIETFLSRNKTFYDKVIAETKKTIPNNIIATMENFFGEFEDKYAICPSPTIFTSFNFGPSIVSKNHKLSYYLLGPAYDLKPNRKHFNEISTKDSLGFNDKEYVRELAIHEFGHSFVRFIDKKNNKNLIEQLSYLNTNKLKENLEKIGEGTKWSTGFEEHLVRATEIMVWRKLGEQKIADEKLKYEREVEGLLYINQFVNSLEKYESKRDEYITLESYFTELVSDLMNIKNK